MRTLVLFALLGSIAAFAIETGRVDLSPVIGFFEEETCERVLEEIKAKEELRTHIKRTLAEAQRLAPFQNGKQMQLTVPAETQAQLDELEEELSHLRLKLSRMSR